LASQGIAETKIGGDIQAAVLSTGDELAPAGAALQPGQIYDSNTVLLQSLLASYGARVASAEHCPDRAAEMEAAIRRGLENEVLVITGGVSVGARDLVKPALTTAGATLDLWRVALKPGKPFLFGRAGNCLVFGLPGNPVSAFVTFLLFVRPALLKLMGASDEQLPLRSVPAHVAEEIRNPGDRPHYLRGILRDGAFTVAGRQESHALFGLSRANALLQVQPGATIAAGATVPVLLLD
jgi:molybdopterin molybdotransferase